MATLKVFVRNSVKNDYMLEFYYHHHLTFCHHYFQRENTWMYNKQTIFPH